MSDEQNILPDGTEVDPKEQLRLLKQRADRLGLKYAKNITVERLAKMVSDKLAEGEDTPPTLNTSHAKQNDEPMTEERAKQVRQANLARQMNKLVRVNIQCLNPNKKNWQGEWKTFGNAFVPSIRKFVVFGHDYHVPQGILNTMEESMYPSVVRKKVNGRWTEKTVWKKEYIIARLDKLTKEELKTLERDQRLREGKE